MFKLIIFLLFFNLYSFGPQKSVEQCLKAIEKEPQNADLYIELGEAYLRNDDYENSQKAFNKAIELNPKKADAYYGLSKIYYEKKDYKNALDYALIAENLLKFKAQYKSQVGLIYYKLGEIDKAVEYFKTAIAIASGKKAFYYSMLGNCYIKQGKYNEAIEMFNKVLEEKPWDKRAYADIARAYYKSGNKDKGDEYKALAGDAWQGLEEKEEKYTRSKGWALYKEKKYDEAIKIFETDSKREPNNPDPLIGLAYSYLKKEDFKKALNYADKAVKVASDYSRSYSARGMIYERLNQTNNAIQNYKKALNLDSDDQFAREQLSKILFKSKNYIEAEIYLKSVIENEPDNLFFLKMFGNTLISLKKYKEAYEVFIKCLEIAPADEKSYIKNRLAYSGFMLGTQLENESKTNESLEIFKKVSELAGDTDYGKSAAQKIGR